MKSNNKDQLSLFDAVVEEASVSQKDLHVPIAPVKDKISMPQWDKPFGLPVDIIGNEYLGGYLFKLSTLEAESETYTRPVFSVLLKSLGGLRFQKKAWSQKSFTIFMAELVHYDSFYLGFSLGNSATGSDLLMSFRDKFQKIPAFQGFDSGESEDCIPIFRYDKRYIIEYVEPDGGGTSFVDGKDNYDSGQTIYRRGWQPADMYELTSSRYSKLK